MLAPISLALVIFLSGASDGSSQSYVNEDECSAFDNVAETITITSPSYSSESIDIETIPIEISVPSEELSMNNPEIISTDSQISDCLEIIRPFRSIKREYSRDKLC